MAAYTFNTTAQQEALLTWIVNRANLERNTTFTNEQYVLARFPELLTPYAEGYKQHLLQQVNDAFTVADAATQQQVLGLLKVTP